MTTRIDRAEASALVVASMCISLIQSDPELIERVRVYAKENGAPLPEQNISEHSLSLTDLAVMTMAKRAMAGKGHAASVLERVAEAMRGPHQTMVIPVPQIDEGAAQSAGALALASFAIEHLHTVPEAADAFRAWLDETRPDVKAGENVTQERLEASDQLLTMMAHMADQIAQHEEGHPRHARPEPEDGGEIDLDKLGPKGM